MHHFSWSGQTASLLAEGSLLPVAGLGHLRHLLMGERKLDARLGLGGFPVARASLEQQLRQLFRGGVRQPDRAKLAAGGVVLVAQLFGDVQADIAVLLQQALKIFAFHEVHLARIDAFRRQLVGRAADGGAQSHNFSRFSNLQN